MNIVGAVSHPPRITRGISKVSIDLGAQRTTTRLLYQNSRSVSQRQICTESLARPTRSASGRPPSLARHHRRWRCWCTARQGRIIVFIDESGLSERPCRARTWAPKGQTPVLQYSFSWKQLSVIAGVSYWRFYFRFFPGSIKSPQIVQFLKALQTTIGKKLLIVSDRLQAHRSRLVKEYVEGLNGRIALEHLPAYAPEFEPGRIHLGLPQTSRHAELLRPRPDRSAPACKPLRSMQRRGTLVTAFWKQAELF
jgi:hypothetical protein